MAQDLHGRPAGALGLSRQIGGEDAPVSAATMEVPAIRNKRPLLTALTTSSDARRAMLLGVLLAAVMACIGALALMIEGWSDDSTADDTTFAQPSGDADDESGVLAAGMQDMAEGAEPQEPATTVAPRTTDSSLAAGAEIAASTASSPRITVAAPTVRITVTTAAPATKPTTAAPATTLTTAAPATTLTTAAPATTLTTAAPTTTLTTAAPTTTTTTTTTASPGRNLMVLSGFESPDVAPGDYTMFATVTGWSSTRPIEIWGTGHLGVPSFRGDQHMELNSDGPNTIWQVVELKGGGTYRWGFSHRGRLDSDTVEVLIDGQVVRTHTAAPGTWTRVTGEFPMPADGSAVIGMRALDSGATGNLIDAFTVRRIS